MPTEEAVPALTMRQSRSRNRNEWPILLKQTREPSRVDLGVPDLGALHRRLSEKWTGHAPDVLPSTIAEMDFPLAEPIASALHAAIDRDDLGYAAPASASLREAFAGFAHRRLQWSVDPEQVTLFPDVMTALVEVCRALVQPGEAVAFGAPAYPPFFAELPQAGRVQQLPLEASGSFDPGSLTAAFEDGTRVLVLTNPQNPTGRVLPRAELEEIARLCAHHEVWVLADEVHAPFTFGGTEHVPWLEVSDQARAWGIAFSSASKAFNVAGLKAAFAVTASDPAREALAGLRDLADRAGILGVVAAHAAFSEGDPWLDAVVAQLGENRALLEDMLARELPGVRWRPPDGTYLAWLDCRELELGDDPASVFLERGRIALTPGLEYGRCGAGFVRLNFGTSPDLVAEAVRRMGASL
jgi:cysteine-S-conjugate beta-lyase